MTDASTIEAPAGTNQPTAGIREPGEFGSGGPELTGAQFKRIRQLVYEKCGINLQSGKEVLVRSRLAKHLARHGSRTFDQYVDIVEGDSSQEELRVMIDALTTNKTSFFRESQHFDFLRHTVLPPLKGAEKPSRFWSAGCSTGEEPYSLAIELHRGLGERERSQCRILATDISERVLAEAKAGTYPPDKAEDMPKQLLGQFFTKTSAGGRIGYRVNPEIRSMVHFARLNLMGNWPMKGPFDAIFCRNVMIYFDLPTRQRLVRRFWGLLKQDGYLFVGHSESLTQSSPEFRYIQPAVYQKISG